MPSPSPRSITSTVSNSRVARLRAQAAVVRGDERRRQPAVALFAAAIGLIGCGPAAAPVRVRPPSQMAHQAEVGLLSLGAEPVVDAGISYATFGADVTPDFIAIAISLRNDLDEHVLIARKDIELRANDGEVAHSVSWLALRDDFKHDLGISPLLGAAAMDGARQANDDKFLRWQAMQLPDQLTVEGKGRSGGGFLYFRRGAVGPPPHRLLVRVQKLKSSDDVEIVVEVPGLAGSAMD